MMADRGKFSKFAYANMQQAGQAGAYPPFHYPTPSGDQSAQLLQGYALSQNNANAVPGSMFGAQSAGSYSFDQAASGYSQSPSMPVRPVDSASQVPMQPVTGGFAYPNFSGSFSQYGGMGQTVPPGLSGIPSGFTGDMQQFGPLMANAFGQTMSANGAILEAIAHEQGLAGFNPVAFLQDPTGASRMGSGRGSGQRGGYNKFGGVRSNSNLPSVTNPDGLREDTIFVSNLPQNIDHEIMKSQFGVVGKIKINSKSGMPMIWIFKEKGVPKGDALVTYEDPSCVQSAIQWFKEHEFMGRKLEVKQATNSQRPVIIPPGGGANNMSGANAMINAGLLGGSGNGPTNPTVALAAAAVAAAASGNTMASLMNNSAAAAASLAALTGNAPNSQFDGKDGSNRNPMSANRGGRGGGAIANGSTQRPVGGSNQAGSREGDWSCQECGNINFSWREQCNRCQFMPNPDFYLPAVKNWRKPGPGGITDNDKVCPIPGTGRGFPMNQVPSANRGGRSVGPMKGSDGMGMGRARPAPY